MVALLLLQTPLDEVKTSSGGFSQLKAESYFNTGMIDAVHIVDYTPKTIIPGSKLKKR